MKKEKELKDCQMKVRVTESFRRKMIEYCDNCEITISELIRLALENYLEIREGKNESAYN